MKDKLSPTEALAHPRVRFVDVPPHRLEYIDLPAHQVNRPTLVLMHEGLGSVSMWRDFPSHIASVTGCRTIAYSRYGHGRSSRRTAPYDVGFMHDEARQVLPALREALHIERPVLLGHSTGASMALIHAGDRRFDVEGVIAMAPLCFVEDSNLDSIRRARGVYESTDMRAKLARHHDDVDGVFYGWNAIWLDPAFKRWRIDEDLAGIRCPVLAILGEDDEYSTRAQIDAITHHATGARRVDVLILADCRHAPHRDQPEVVTEAIEAFIDSLDA